MEKPRSLSENIESNNCSKLNGNYIFNKEDNYLNDLISDKLNLLQTLYDDVWKNNYHNFRINIKKTSKFSVFFTELQKKEKRRVNSPKISFVKLNEDFQNKPPTKSKSNLNDLNIYVEKIFSRDDTRTSIMWKNIPNKYNEEMLRNLLDIYFKDSYNLIILPSNSKKDKNFGYAFVNFNHYLYIPSFYYLFHNKKWPNTNSEKICEITYSKIQGFNHLINQYKSDLAYLNTSLINKKITKRTFIFPFIFRKLCFKYYSIYCIKDNNKNIVMELEC